MNYFELRRPNARLTDLPNHVIVTLSNTIRSLTPMTETTSVRLGSRKEQLQALAETYKRPMHSLLIEAVDEFIQSRSEQLAYERRAIKAYEHWKETGLHITTDELQAWADSLGTDNQMELAQCHK